MTIKSYIFIAVIIATLTASFYTYYAVSQRKISSLTESVAQLTLSLETQTKILANVQAAYSRQTAALSSLNTANTSLYLEKERLSTKLMQHDLEELSRRKPALVETRINNGTKDIFRSLVDITAN